METAECYYSSNYKPPDACLMAEGHVESNWLVVLCEETLSPVRIILKITIFFALVAC